MENLQIILSVAGTALGLLVTAVTFLIKFIKAIRAKNSEERARLWKEFSEDAVKAVEILKGKSNGELTGATKKEIALNKVEAACVRAGIKFDKAAVDSLIEQIVMLTKTVNPRAKDSAGPVFGTSAATGGV